MTYCCLTQKTPLIAAFFVLVTVLAGCGQGSGVSELPGDVCYEESIPISHIQGDGDVSPMLGGQVKVRAVVTHIEPDSGFYVQQDISDSSHLTSEGLYVRHAALAATLLPGDWVVLTGTVAETGEGTDTITTLDLISGQRVCASNRPLPVNRFELPLPRERREPLEAMNLATNQELFVTDPFGASRGRLTLSVGGILPAPTEVARPGRGALAQSARNRRSSLEITLAKNDVQLYPAGTTVLSASGVMGHDGKGQRLLMNKPARTIPVRVNRTSPPAPNDIRVVSVNLHNYFNGDGQGAGFPTPRGAKSPKEFAAQRARLAATIKYLEPHLVTVMELENDGFGPDSAARDFIHDLEGASDHEWRVVTPSNGKVGGDVITVGIFFRVDRMAAVGNPVLLSGPEFDGLSRVPMAQQFSDQRSGQAFLVVVNHLKSKGSCPESGRNGNMRDGQGCWNPARTEAAKIMSQWAQNLANVRTGGKALVLGDMNAYRMEDPISAILDAGFKDLNAPDGLSTEFSHIYGGRAGTLDYAFASGSLMPFVRLSSVLNLNSPYARDLELPLEFLGASDHDPVLVDLRFRQASTSD